MAPQPAAVGGTAIQPGQAPRMPTPEELSKGDKRIMGVLPNYKTVPDASAQFTPITARQKFYIATHDSFDPPMYGIALFYAGLAQVEHQYPSWGLGAKGLGKRYVASFADQALSNFITEAIIPTALHEDPRYFRLGERYRPAHRIAYALTRVFVTRTDSGARTFNFAEIGGTAASAAIGSAYYPADQRTAYDVGLRFGTQVAFDSLSGVLKEYWPDIRRKLSRRQDTTTSLPNPSVQGR
jgi:hypothetical protein